ncbi:MAG: outer membrane protein assembly factor BamB family protein [Limisphaerales bacterium]
MKTIIGSLLWCLVAGFSVGSLRAEDWPQWRGPNRDGISRETGLLKEWPQEGPKLLWQAKGLGGGYSTPAVIGDRLYIINNEGLESEFVKCLSTTDGKQLWSTKIGKVGEPKQNPSYPGARSTTTVDGDSLFVLGSDGDLVCLDTGGKIRWQKNVRQEFGGKPGRWAYAESPLVNGDAVICTPGGESATLLALNKKTGEVIWKSAVPGGDAAGYASIVIGQMGGTKQYAQFVEKGLIGVDAKTGKLLWRYDRVGQGSPANIPTPVVFEDYVFAGANRSGGALVKVSAKDGKFEAEPVYFESKMPTGIGGVVKVGKELYGTSGRAMLCLDFLTGQIRWEEAGIGAASSLFADGRLYLHGENGEVAMVEASPEGYREKGRFTPPDMPDRGQSKSWAHPVLANGRLYIHELGTIWCFDIAGKTVALR